MNALIVCVDFSDMLEITLQKNRHHFDRVVVVTTFTDEKTIVTALNNNAEVYRTNAFYDDGAVFNKYKAVEEGLDFMGRYGQICLLDVDIVLPKDFLFTKDDTFKDYLYTPHRYIFDEPHQTSLNPKDEGYLNERLISLLEDEELWKELPLFGEREFAGYCQVFHADCRFLPKGKSWHETNWKHAGGADSFFQCLWPDQFKVRPPFYVLHLGPPGRNWCGRVIPYLDGTLPENSDESHNTLQRFFQGRQGKQGLQKFDHEKL